MTVMAMNFEDPSGCNGTMPRIIPKGFEKDSEFSLMFHRLLGSPSEGHNRPRGYPRKFASQSQQDAK